ncbi:hypothetical protein [Kocuria sp.]|uniref:hypothetical protein n=1 Tax=Kocuria sp. TaxID=1871328 RepID=UPI0026E06D1F|nr:hypothetical protein [Kocuria sp.]MDO5617239.1 hypothetical protein [Kocuria sp.]
MSSIDRRAVLGHAAWAVPAVAVATAAPAYAASQSMDLALWQTNHHLPAAAGADTFRLAWVGSSNRPTSGLVITLRAYEIYRALNAAGVTPMLQTSSSVLTLGAPIRTTDTGYRGGAAQTSPRAVNTWQQTITLPAGFTSAGSADFQINWPDRNGVNGTWQYTFEITQRLPSPTGETADDNSGNDVLMANRSSVWVRTEPMVGRWSLWDNRTLDTSVFYRQYGTIPSVSYPAGYVPVYTAPTLG